MSAPGKPNNRGLIIAGLFVAFLFSFCGLASLGTAVRDGYHSLAAAKWPTVRGRIVDARLENRLRRGYPVKVDYHYVVDGKPYVGSRLAFGYPGTHYERGVEILDKLKRGGAINVRFNPVDPADSTLSCGWHQSIQGLAVFGATCLAFATCFAALVWVGTRRDRVLLRNLVTYRIRTEWDEPQGTE